ncbi:acyltransferase family protein [Treponema sp.]|uniref:acyltransferase family protein n=1 Tax=Treponema sp. TaxID=166 RepID=UPI003F120BF3
MVDVPLFFFLSGWSSSFSKTTPLKTAKSIFQIYLKWCFFILAVSAVCFLSVFTPLKTAGSTNVSDVAKALLLHPNIQILPVIAGSIWFVPVYFLVLFLNSILIAFMQNSGNFEANKKYICVFYAVLFVWTAAGFDFPFKNPYFIFYSFFWSLGFIRKELGTVSLKKYIAATAVFIFGFIFSAKTQHLPVLKVQAAKFPPSLAYGFFSLLSIFTFLFLENHINIEGGKFPNVKKFLAHIGRNALFYYFAQGIGSSAIYILRKLNIRPWFLHFGAAFLVNLVTTVLLAESFSALYVKCEKLAKNILKKNCQT